MSTTNKPDADKWINLSTINRRLPDHMPYPIKLNDEEFFMSKDSALYKYNIFNNEWTEWIKYPENVKIEKFALGCLHKKNKLIYIYLGRMGKLLKIHYDTENIDIIDNLNKVGNVAILTIINDELHLIGGTDNKQHLIFNEKTNIFDQLQDFPDIVGKLYGMGFIQISNEKLMVIGGSDGSGVLNSMYSFSSYNSKWRKLDLTLPVKLCHFAFTITDNKRYIILLGGITGTYQYHPNIYVIDLKLMTILKTSILCPTKSSSNTSNFYAIIMSGTSRDKLLVFGYIRQNVLIHFPNNLVKLIELWYCMEELHLLEQLNGTENHWKIKVDDILNSI